MPVMYAWATPKQVADAVVDCQEDPVVCGAVKESFGIGHVIGVEVCAARTAKETSANAAATTSSTTYGLLEGAW